MAQKTQVPISPIVDDDRQSATPQATVGSGRTGCGAFASAEELCQLRLPKRRFPPILDVRLPNMSGLELQRYPSDRARPVPIIFITGHAEAGVRDRRCVMVCWDSLLTV